MLYWECLLCAIFWWFVKFHLCYVYNASVKCMYFLGWGGGACTTCTGQKVHSTTEHIQWLVKGGTSMFTCIFLSRVNTAVNNITCIALCTGIRKARCMLCLIFSMQMLYQSFTLSSILYKKLGAYLVQESFPVNTANQWVWARATLCLHFSCGKWNYRFLIPVLRHIEQYWRMITHRASESVYCTTKRR